MLAHIFKLAALATTCALSFSHLTAHDIRAKSPQVQPLKTAPRDFSSVARGHKSNGVTCMSPKIYVSADSFKRFANFLTKVRCEQDMVGKSPVIFITGDDKSLVADVSDLVARSGKDEQGYPRLTKQAKRQIIKRFESFFAAQRVPKVLIQSLIRKSQFGDGLIPTALDMYGFTHSANFNAFHSSVDRRLNLIFVPTNCSSLAMLALPGGYPSASLSIDISRVAKRYLLNFVAAHEFGHNSQDADSSVIREVEAESRALRMERRYPDLFGGSAYLRAEWASDIVGTLLNPPNSHEYLPLQITHDGRFIEIGAYLTIRAPASVGQVTPPQPYLADTDETVQHAVMFMQRLVFDRLKTRSECDAKLEDPAICQKSFATTHPQETAQALAQLQREGAFRQTYKDDWLNPREVSAVEEYVPRFVEAVQILAGVPTPVPWRYTFASVKTFTRK